MQKFLIVQTAFIGDVVLATPIIEKLHAFFPEAQIDFLVRKGNESLLYGHPYLHEVLIWNKKEHKQRNLFRIIRKIRTGKYDYVINVQRFFATGLITAFSGARQTIGFDKNPLSFLFSKRIQHTVGGPNSMHEVDRNLLLVNGFTDTSYKKPKLYPSVNDFQLADSLAHRPFVTISPASVWFTKQFPASQWISFIKKIPDQYEVYLLGGGTDTTLCEMIATSADRPGIQIYAGKLSFLQSAAVMSKSVMNYVNDSAPMHFASAVDAPVTAVYCSTVPEFGFGPLSSNSQIVEVEEKLSCRPCGLHGYRECPMKHFRCALDIRTEQLMTTLPL